MNCNSSQMEWEFLVALNTQILEPSKRNRMVSIFIGRVMAFRKNRYTPLDKEMAIIKDFMQIQDMYVKAHSMETKMEDKAITPSTKDFFIAYKNEKEDYIRQVDFNVDFFPTVIQHYTNMWKSIVDGQVSITLADGRVIKSTDNECVLYEAVFQAQKTLLSSPEFIKQDIVQKIKFIMMDDRTRMVAFIWQNQAVALHFVDFLQFYYALVNDKYVLGKFSFVDMEEVYQDLTEKEASSDIKIKTENYSVTS